MMQILLESKQTMLQGYNADWSKQEFYEYAGLICRKCDGKVVDILKI